MILTNYHSHFNLCDGKGGAWEYVREAIRQGFLAYGFSSHAPLPFANTWTLREEDLPAYLDETSKLKSEYKNRIQLYSGLEIDYMRGIMGPSSEKYAGLGLDYKIGSMHMLKNSSTGEYLSVDGPDTEFIALLEEEFRGSIKDMVSEYYRQVNYMLEEHCFDILGHIDLVKKKNRDSKYFNEDEKYYKNIVMETLDLAAEKKVIIEINTGGMARGATKEVYPSPWIIKECAKRKIPMTINSDCHDPKQISYYFPEAFLLLKDAGYRTTRILLDSTWKDYPIED